MQERFIRATVTPDARSAIAREFPHESTDLFINKLGQDAKIRRKSERKAVRVERRRQRADWYHEHVYTKVAKVQGKITDSVPFSIAEATLTPVGAYSLARLPDYVSPEPILVPEEVQPYIDTPLAIAVVGLVGVSVSYFLNKSRTRPSEKMGIKPEEYDPVEQVTNVIGELNQRQAAPRLSYDEISPLAADAVTDFLERCDGYRTEATRTVKRAWPLGRFLFKRVHLQGLMNPAFGEIALRDKKEPGAPAHELTHARGVLQESEAEFVGVAAQVTSGNPSLEYVGYLNWLDLLARNSGIPRQERRGILHGLGLNHQTLDELQTLWEERAQKQKRRLRRTRQALHTLYEAALPEGVKVKLAGARYRVDSRNLALKSTGQSDFMTDYNSLPLELLANFEKKRRIETSDQAE